MGKKKRKYTNLGLAYVAEHLLTSDQPQYAAIVDKAHEHLEKVRRLRNQAVCRFADHCGAGPMVGVMMTEAEYKKFDKLLDKIETFLDWDDPV